MFNRKELNEAKNRIVELENYLSINETTIGNLTKHFGKKNDELVELTRENWQLKKQLIVHEKTINQNRQKYAILEKRYAELSAENRINHDDLEKWKPLAEVIVSFEIPDEVAFTVPEKAIKLIERLIVKQ